MAEFKISWDCGCGSIEVVLEAADQAAANDYCKLYDGTDASYSPTPAAEVKCAGCGVHRTNVVATPV